MKARAAFFALAVVVLAASAFPRARSERRKFFPQLRPGQTLDYLVSFQSRRDINTQSNVIVPNLPGAGSVTVLATLRVEVLPSQHGLVRLRTFLKPLSLAPGKPSAQAPAPSDISAVEFSLDGGGSVSQIAGLDSLPVDQQAAWREWVARFAASLTFPKNGVKAGDTWESEEPETAPSPIAGLVWRKKSQYVRDEPCPEAHRAAQGDFTEAVSATQTCAVILTTAVLQQKSSAKDATPEDYKLNRLRTSGTAAGKNQSILYISRATGMLMRSSETAAQSMSVTISLSSGGNQVHYDVSAQSNARVLFIQQAPASRH